MMRIGDITVGLWDPATQSFSNPNIPYNIHSSSLQTALQQIVGMERVYVHGTGTPNTGATWQLHFRGYHKEVP